MRPRQLALLAVTVVILSGGCSGAGGPKPDAPPHHREGGFANQNPGYVRAGFWTRWSFFASRVVASTFAPRRASSPVEANAVTALTAKDVPKNVYTILCLIGVEPDEEQVLAA